MKVNCVGGIFLVTPAGAATITTTMPTNYCYDYLEKQVDGIEHLDKGVHCPLFKG